MLFNDVNSIGGGGYMQTKSLGGGLSGFKYSTLSEINIKATNAVELAGKTARRNASSLGLFEDLERARTSLPESLSVKQGVEVSIRKSSRLDLLSKGSRWKDKAFSPSLCSILGVTKDTSIFQWGKSRKKFDFLKARSILVCIKTRCYPTTLTVFQNVENKERPVDQIYQNPISYPAVL